MKQLGYSMGDFSIIEFLEFININADVKILPKDLQQLRYDHIENVRLQKIADATRVNKNF